MYKVLICNTWAGRIKYILMKIIGLTGNIASGKTTVARMFESLGAKIIDADLIAREVVEPDKPAWKEIEKHFGNGIMNDDRTIDRQKMGAIIFNNEDKRKILNSITHPRITEEIKKQIEHCRKEGAVAVVVEAALIVENSGWLKDAVDSLVVVRTDNESQIKRMTNRDEYTIEEAEARISSQMPSAEKERHGDYVIDNSGSLEQTEKQVMGVWNNIIEAS